jgi:hypothetical protein
MQNLTKNTPASGAKEGGEEDFIVVLFVFFFKSFSFLLLLYNNKLKTNEEREHLCSKSIGDSSRFEDVLEKGVSNGVEHNFNIVRVGSDRRVNINRLAWILARLQELLFDELECVVVVVSTYSSC